MSLSLSAGFLPGLIGGPSSGFPIFRTKSAPASRPALYQLRLCAPVINSVELSTYTFPLTPSSLRYERSPMSSFNDTQAPGILAPLVQGVTRQIDSYGLSPPIITIEGTTGWDYHSADGYSLTGLQSIQQLATFLATYADLNQIQRVAGFSYLYTLEFYDYFTSNFWVVEPVPPQIFQQDAQRPLLSYYRFRFAATVPAGGVASIIDEISNALSVGSQLAGTNLSLGLSNTLGNYNPSGPSNLAVDDTTV